MTTLTRDYSHESWFKVQEPFDYAFRPATPVEVDEWRSGRGKFPQRQQQCPCGRGPVQVVIGLVTGHPHWRCCEACEREAEAEALAVA